MKKLFTLALSLLMFIGSAKSQAGSNAYTNAILDWTSHLSDVVYGVYKDTLTLRRIETGTLIPDGGRLVASADRDLYSGREYLIFATTDSRINSFKLKAYISKDGNWTLLKEVDENDNSLNKKPLMGSIQHMSIAPTENANYKFEIDASNANGAGRYAIMLWSKDISTNNTQTNAIAPSPLTSSSGKTIYTVDSYSVAQYDSNGVLGDFGTAQAYQTNFEINADETTVRKIDPNGSITVYQILEKKVDNNKWTEYTIQSPDNTKFGFFVPNGAGSNILAFKLGSEHNPVTDYHIQSKNVQ